jgi:hypothetical protein
MNLKATYEDEEKVHLKLKVCFWNKMIQTKVSQNPGG